MHSNFFYSYYSKDKNNKKYSWQTKIIFLILILIILIFSFINVGFETSNNGWNIFKDNMNNFFKFNDHSPYYPSYSLWNLSFEFLFLTIKQTIVGTTFGFIIALFTSFLSYKKFNNNFNSYLINSFVFVLRIFPIFIFLYFFEFVYSKEVALILIFMWFSWLWMHKYLIEIYNSINFKQYYQLIVEGNNSINAFFKSIYFQINSRILSLFLYSFESNMRWSTILSSLGLLGIGQLIILGQYNFENIGIPITVLTLFMIFLEILNLMIKKIFIYKNCYFIENKIFKNKHYKYKKFKLIFFYILLSLFFILFIYSLSTINWNFYGYKLGNLYLDSIFNPNWTILNNVSHNIFVQIIDILSIAICILFLSFIMVIFSLFLGNKFLFPKTNWIINLINIIFRSFPTIGMVFIISSYYINPTSSIVISFSLSLYPILYKIINEKINKIDIKNINHLSVLGYSKFYIFKNYIFQMIKNTLLLQFIFETENTLRNIILYGSFGSSEIASQIDYFYKKNMYQEMGAYLWVIFFILFIFNIFVFIIKYKNMIKKDFKKIILTTKYKILNCRNL